MIFQNTLIWRDEYSLTEYKYIRIALGLKSINYDRNCIRVRGMAVDSYYLLMILPD